MYRGNHFQSALSHTAFQSPTFLRESYFLRERLKYASQNTCSSRRQYTTCSISNYTTVLIVPTGVGAAIGGYAGDAIPAARVLSSISDTLITHPNVLNGALMYWPINNALYVEGSALDLFAAGRLGLKHPGSNKIGLLLDQGMPHDARLRHQQAAEAARATLGLRIEAMTVTDSPLQVSLLSSPLASSGSISNVRSLLVAGQRLIDAGCNAIAVVAEFPDDEDPTQLADYRAGNGVDAIAGAEAVISHLMTRELGIPCAHAPSLPPLSVDPTVSPKAAAEELGYTFLSCVLVGLSRAPQMVPLQLTSHLNDTITASDVDSVVVPKNAFGGSALMKLAATPNTLVVAVEENETAVDIHPSMVGIDPKKVLFAKSYAEAAGFLAAHKVGVDIRSISKTIPKLEPIEDVSLNAIPAKFIT